LYYDLPCISDESLEAATNIVENNEFIYYNNKEDRDTAMSSLSKSEIDNNDNNDGDNSDIRNVLSNLIDKAADLSPFRYKSPL
jgi:hypothetical protein